LVEIAIVIMILLIYLVPYSGIVKLTPPQLEVQKDLCNFELDIEETELVDEKGDSSLIDSDFSTLETLGELKVGKKENNLPTKSNDYRDIDISNM